MSLPIQPRLLSSPVRAGSFYPTAEPPSSAVLLLGVSGPNERDLSIGALKPFAALAEHLRGVGVAVLTLDDRGVGGSGGDWSRAGHDVFTGDALAAVRWLRARTGLSFDRVGLLGLSEGSAIAMRVAAEPEEVGFIVLGSPPGLTGEESLRAQLDGALSSARIDGTTADRYRNLFTRFLELSPVAASDEVAFGELIRFLEGPGTALVPPYSFLPTGAREQAILFSGPWYRSQVEYDPTRFLLRITVPVLIVGGGLDPVLPPHRHHPPIVAAIGSPDVHAEVVPDVNHLLLPATTGSPAEYATIRDPADERVLSVITHWLTARDLAWSRGHTSSTRDAMQ